MKTIFNNSFNKSSRSFKITTNFNYLGLYRYNFKSFTTTNDTTHTNPLDHIDQINPKRLYNNKTIFLDFQSTTPLDPRVLDAMMPYNTEFFGNPHSKSHVYGWNAEDAVEVARQVILY